MIRENFVPHTLDACTFIFDLVPKIICAHKHICSAVKILFFFFKKYNCSILCKLWIEKKIIVHASSIITVTHRERKGEHKLFSVECIFWVNIFCWFAAYGSEEIGYLEWKYLEEKGVRGGRKKQRSSIGTLCLYVHLV